MKLLTSWLNDFVDLSDFNIKEIIQSYTMKAFEVEDYQILQNKIDPKIILGQIIEINKHPNADKLQITRTKISETEILQIVCGAKNIQVGQYVPVATIGAKVFSTKDQCDFVIKESKIRDIESFGMLCSGEELKLEQDLIASNEKIFGKGIFILEDNQDKLGHPITQILNIQEDYVLEIGARSNRGDALSVYGQAREFAGIFNRPLKPTPTKTLQHNQNIKSIEPKIESDNDTEVFYTIALHNLKISESPAWLKYRLKAAGIKSINNIVDVSNYLLIELGQPMHFYDLSKLHGDYIWARRAREGESIISLEDKDYELNEKHLIIADAKGPVSIAGIMGGKESSINEKTNSVLIEVAVFHSALVRKNSRDLGIESESKRRFERGVDKSFSKVALLRAVTLLLELAGTENTQISSIKSSGQEEIKEHKLKLNSKNLTKILGAEISENTIEELLKSINITKTQEQEYLIPNYRAKDLTREIDLIEEIARLYGYDKFIKQAPRLISAAKSNLNKNTEKAIAKLLAKGFNEIKLSSLIGESLENYDTSFGQNLNKISMDNPLSQEHRSLRRSLLPGLIQAASKNYAYDKSSEIKLFEVGKIYSRIEANLMEKELIGVILSNPQKNWNETNLENTYFKFKSILELLFPENLNLDSSICPELLHPKISAHILKAKKTIGKIGKLHPSSATEWDLPTETYLLEIEIPVSLRLEHRPLSTKPFIERDLTADTPLEFQEIRNFLLKHSKENLEKIDLISVFENEKFRSLSFRLRWQAQDQTLTNQEIDLEFKKLLSLLEKELKVTFRGIDS